jgi:hypothetical protein
VKTTRPLVITLLRVDPWLASHLGWRMLIRSLVVFMCRLMLRSSRHLTRRRISSCRSIGTLAEVFPEKEADTSEDSNTSERGTNGDTSNSTSRKTLIPRVRSSFCC